MALVKSVTEALQSSDAKKETLRKTFEDLQLQSSLLSSFTLQWRDLEDHFDSIRKSVDDRIKHLESLESLKPKSKVIKPKQSTTTTTTPVTDSKLKPKLKPKQSTPKQVETPVKEDPVTKLVHPEMRLLCVKNDAMGLRSYMVNHRTKLNSIRDEVGVALKASADPAKLVLDAMQGFYVGNAKGDSKDGGLFAIRGTCILLLEQLASISPIVKPQLKERAKKLALEWKGNVGVEEAKSLESLGFLQLLASFGLASSFESNDIIDVIISISRNKRKQAIDLCRTLCPAEKISDLIQKLSKKGRQLEAVRFVYELELVDKFPPVPLLKAYLKQTQKVAGDLMSKNGSSSQSQHDAISKELGALKAIIKCIEDHNLQAEYPRESLDKRIEQLEKQKSSLKKRPVTDAQQESKITQPQQSAIKRPRPTALNSEPTSSHLISQYPPLNLHDHLNPYLNSSQYGMFNARQYLSNGASSYGSGTSLPGYGLNLSPPRSRLFPSNSSLTSSIYDRPIGMAGLLGLPPSHRSLFNP